MEIVKAERKLATYLQENFLTSCKALNKYNTTELCIKANVPTLGAMLRGTDGETMELIIGLFISKLQEDLDLKRSMEAHQIQECARLVLEDFKRLNITDINLVLTNARKGKYGDFYESINMAKVYSWFETYYNQRMEVAGTISIKETQKHKYNAKRNNDGKWIDFIK